MRLNAGRVTINKPIDKVFSFLIQLENLEKQLPTNMLDDYTVEFDNDIAGSFEIGTIISVYLLAKYEGDEDKCCGFEVKEVDKNKEIKLDLIYFGKFDEQKEDWSDHDPAVIENILGITSIEIIFTPKESKTLITVVTVVNPKLKFVGIVIRFINFIGRWGNKKHIKEWAKLIERHT